MVFRSIELRMVELGRGKPYSLLVCHVIANLVFAYGPRTRRYASRQRQPLRWTQLHPSLQVNDLILVRLRTAS